MAIFELALDVVLDHEGAGFTEDPDDPGGATRWGITLKTLRRIDPAATKDDVKSLSPERASGIYRQIFWDSLHLDLLEDQTMATKIFDVAVNCGPSQAIELAQRACRDCEERIDVDGCFGPKTLETLNHITPRRWLLAMIRRQEEHYSKWIAGAKEREKYRRGLMRRAMWPMVHGAGAA